MMAINALRTAGFSLPLFLALGATAGAGIVDNNTVTIINAFAPAFPGFSASNAIDTGPNHLVTDYASFGGYTNTFISFDLGKPYILDAITVTDRTTSGRPNGAFFGGLTDKVTSYDLLLSLTDPTFTSGTTIFHVNSPAPVQQISPADFMTTTAIGNLLTRYVEFKVTGAAAGQGNTGMADIVFDAVTPEPSSLTLLSTGAAFCGLVLRRLRQPSSV
jgi:hypothetical protein